jgi:hypothetical protein
VKRLMLVVLLVAAPSAAAAAPWPPAAAPAGTAASAEQGARLAGDLEREGHFGGAALDPGATAATVFVGDGASLLAWRVATAGPVADPAGSARAELDLVRGASAAAASDGSKTEETAWSEHVVPADRTVEAELAWRHLDLGTTTRTRIVLSATGAGLEVVAGECVLRDDDAASFDAACARFLAGVAPTTAAGDRVALTIGGAAAAEPPAVGSGGGSGGGPTLTAPVGPMPPTTIPVIRPPPKKNDLRPLYIAAGLLLLAAVFLWNRTKRKEMEAEYGKTRPRRRWRKVGGDEDGAGAGDEDAEALAGAAAEGDEDEHEHAHDDDDDEAGDDGTPKEPEA